LRDVGTVIHWGTGVRAGAIPGFDRIVAIAGLTPSGILGLKEDGPLVQAPAQSLSPIPPGLSNVVAIGGIGVPSVALIRGSDEPCITQHPQCRTVSAVSTVTFRVTAVAGQPLRYQWQFNGVELRGATDDTLNIKAAWPAQQRHNRVRVTAAGLTVTSRAGLLKVVPGL
jgi:hypothetical protein